MQPVKDTAHQGEGARLRPVTPVVTPEKPDRRQVVLLVEDNEADRDLYGSLLWYNGYEVVHATNGEEALRRALEIRPELILLDITLPGRMTGLDVARRLLEADFQAPIFALTAHSRQELGEAAREAGIVAFLEKPIDPFAVVKEVMRQIGYARPDENGC